MNGKIRGGDLICEANQVATPLNMQYINLTRSNYTNKNVFSYIFFFTKPCGMGFAFPLIIFLHLEASL